ncbi:MAG: hypothetical protein Nk1A_4240 [Endomicrobiia bacterium]|nr:MAG: hypothetical protein Nk1A_4240 [Endomicrobiia bacterium]
MLITMQEVEFKGKTVTEAINKGLSQLGCDKERVKIKIVSEGSMGLFGLIGIKPAIVLMSIDVDGSFKCRSKTAISN